MPATCCKRLLEMRINIFGSEHQIVATTLNSLALIYASLEHYKKAGNINGARYRDQGKGLGQKQF